MSLVLAFFLTVAIGIQADSQQPESATIPASHRSVRLHLPSGTKIGPNDKVAFAKIKKRVNPTYPPLARQTHISGTVVLHVTITTDGALQDIEVVSGHPLLIQAALDAVKQWQYEPTFLNGTPVEVDTTIDVIFAPDDKKPASGTPANTAPDNATPVRMQGGTITPPKLVKRVAPVYPEAARRKGVEGSVEFRLVLNKDGSVKTLDVLSGDSLLVQAAKDAVMQWRYSQTLLNGEPVEVDTKASVAFKLDQK